MIKEKILKGGEKEEMPIIIKNIEVYSDTCDICGKEISDKTLNEVKNNMKNHKFFKHNITSESSDIGNVNKEQ